MEDVKGKELYEQAKDFYNSHEYIKALEVIEDLSFVKLNDDKDKAKVNFLQGSILKILSDKTDNSDDVKFTYLLASVEIFLSYLVLSPFAAHSLFHLAEYLESVSFYKKALVKAKQSVGKVQDFEHLKHIIETSESKIAESKNGVASRVKKREERVKESKENEETRNSGFDLKSYWESLNVEVRRNFLKVSVAEFRSFVDRVYGKEGVDALMQVLASAKKDRKWMFWMCRTCVKKFSSADECKNHFELEHAATFTVKLTEFKAQMISEAWARKVSDGGWEPVDAVAAVGMIKNQLEDVKVFAYENGWSKDWPLAADEERRKLLCEIQQLLMSFYDRKVLSCSILGWVMDSAINHFEELEVPEQTLIECLLAETPQSICFMECDELNEILDFLKSIKCDRNDGTDLVCRAVESFCDGTRVKEKIDFDPKFSFLLLDKRLLQGKIARYYDEGTINVIKNPNAQYARENVHEDDILSWLDDNTSRDETNFLFPRPIRRRNLDIWVAVLRAIQFTCRTLGAKYSKKLKLIHYDATLNELKTLCMLEDERRKNFPEDQMTSYATRICDKYETLFPRSSHATRIKLSAVRHVLEATLDPTFDLPNSEDSLNAIRELKNVGDDSVLTSIEHLQSIFNDKISYKVPRIDTNILLIENSRINLLNQLTRLSVFDYRSYILGPLKEFLLQRILDMESKAKIAEANADLLIEEEEERKPQSKKKKKKEKPSTSMPSPLDKTTKHEPEDARSSDTGQLETSSNTDHQAEAAKRASQLINMAGESSLSKHLGSTHGASATRCKSALEMTLKALCNIQVLKEYLVRNQDQFPLSVEGQVPLVLRNFFAAFALEAINDKGVYNYLLEDLLASLESRDAAELLVCILEFWPCWKNPEIESVVTHLFTLEEYERMSCSKCGKIPNYPEQSSYGIVMAADSVRDLKRAFENMKFEDILKVNRMEDKMLCECGKANFVHRIIRRCPFIFTIVLEWVKDETAEEISETTKALDSEIDISRLYQGLEPNEKFRLSSMVGYSNEEEDYICLAYKKDQWFSLKNEALSEDADFDVVGDWNNVVSFCMQKKVRLEILFYEDASLMT